MRSFSLAFSPVLEEEKGAKTDQETTVINDVPSRYQTNFHSVLETRVLVGFRLAATSRFFCVLSGCYDAD